MAKDQTKVQDRGRAPFIPQTPEQARQRDSLAGVPGLDEYEVQTTETISCVYRVRAPTEEAAVTAMMAGHTAPTAESVLDTQIVDVRRLGDPAPS